MKKQIIIINGVGYSGKDAFIEFCSELVKVENVSSIDPARKAIRYLVGESDDKHASKSEEMRALLHDLKVLSIKYNDYPFTYIRDKINGFIQSHKDVLFIHIREADEINKISEFIKTNIKPEAVDLTTVLFERSNVPQILSNEADANVKDYTYDRTVYNNGTLLDLKNTAKEFISSLGGLQ